MFKRRRFPLIDFMLTDWRNTRAAYHFLGKAFTTMHYWRLHYLCYRF